MGISRLAKANRWRCGRMLERNNNGARNLDDDMVLTTGFAVGGMDRACAQGWVWQE
jgi:hypothetical protein